MLEIEKTPSSSGAIELHQSPLYINAVEVLWNARTGANVTIRCNCTSTAFAPHKHGGEKGIHMRLQIDTYEIVSSMSRMLKRGVKDHPKSDVENDSLLFSNNLATNRKQLVGKDSNVFDTPSDLNYVKYL